MSFDLRVLVVGQKKPIKYNTRIQIIVEMQGKINVINRPFLSVLNGVLYSLGTTKEGIFNAMRLIDTEFEETDKIPYWIKDDGVKSNLTDLSFLDDYREDLIDLLMQMTISSPNNLIIIWPRYQSGDREIYYGSMTLMEFIDALDNGELLFNVCYIIDGCD